MNYRLNKIISTLEKRKENHPEENETIDGIIDTIKEFLELLGLENNRPVLSCPQPENEKTSIDCNIEKVFITVEDLEGDPFSVKIYDENGYINTTSGEYPIGQHNGSFNATLNTPLPPNTEITWNVLVIDENEKEVTGEYKFTTGYE
jgi:hypothetical protein